MSFISTYNHKEKQVYNVLALISKTRTFNTNFIPNPPMTVEKKTTTPKTREKKRKLVSLQNKLITTRNEREKKINQSLPYFPSY